VKWLSAVVAVLAIAAVGMTGFAYGPGEGGRNGDGRRPCDRTWCQTADDSRTKTGVGYHRRLDCVLGLSKEQTDRMVELKRKYSEQVKVLREDLFRKTIEARTFFADPKSEEGTIVAKEKELAAIRDKLRQTIVQFRLEQRRILTAEQLEQLAEFRAGLDGRGSQLSCGWKRTGERESDGEKTAARSLGDPVLQ
jgi:hypothetical protein